uniref:collagen-like triple helix repeat-containing protein n=1 Tax=uncultured Clostridium sp. TaxID=59620 RepID=UPI0025CB85F0
GATGVGITGPAGATGIGITGPAGATGVGITGPAGATGPVSRRIYGQFALNHPFNCCHCGCIIPLRPIFSCDHCISFNPDTSCISLCTDVVYLVNWTIVVKVFKGCYSLKAGIFLGNIPLIPSIAEETVSTCTESTLTLTGSVIINDFINMNNCLTLRLANKEHKNVRVSRAFLNIVSVD